MIVQLTRPTTHAEIVDPADFLLACHGRIRKFTALAGRVAGARDASPSEIAEAARSVERFFRIGIPLHAEDEDRSIAPRVRAAGASSEVVDALASMTAEHPFVDACTADVAKLCATIAEAPAAAFLDELGDRVRELDQLWIAHLGNEESIILPAIRALLDPAEKLEIMAECRARRASIVMP